MVGDIKQHMSALLQQDFHAFQGTFMSCKYSEQIGKL